MESRIAAVPAPLFFALLGLALPTPTFAADLSGSLTGEAVLYRERPAYPEQRELGLRKQPDLAPAFLYPAAIAEARLSLPLPLLDAEFTGAPYLRFDGYDGNRTTADARELKITARAWDARLRLGIDSESWGVMEFFNVTDVLSQRDNLDVFLGKKKMGQGMASAEIGTPFGTFQAFALTFFRPLEFSGPEGRLRPPLPIEEDPVYVSGWGRWQPEGALRYTRTFGPVDANLSHFFGYGREPDMGLELAGGAPVLRPRYRLRHQSGLDAVAILREWVLRAECALRMGPSGEDPTYAASFGIERTLPGFSGQGWDITLVGEYLYDTRAATLVTPFSHNLFGGLRFSLNDIRSSEVSAYYSQDLDADEPSLFVTEASSRIAERIKLVLNGVWIIDPGPASPFFLVAQDSRMSARLSFHY